MIRGHVGIVTCFCCAGRVPSGGPDAEISSYSYGIRTRTQQGGGILFAIKRYTAGVLRYFRVRRTAV